jgi:hypothetical protein
MIHVKIYTLTSKLGQGYCDDSGIRTQSYDCPPLIKYVNCLLYVWSGSGMSMQGMGSPNHILQHVPSENSKVNFSLPESQSSLSFACPQNTKHSTHLYILSCYSLSDCRIVWWFAVVVPVLLSPVRALPRFELCRTLNGVKPRCRHVLCCVVDIFYPLTLGYTRLPRC